MWEYHMRAPDLQALRPKIFVIISWAKHVWAKKLNKTTKAVRPEDNLNHITVNKPACCKPVFRLLGLLSITFLPKDLHFAQTEGERRGKQEIYCMCSSLPSCWMKHHNLQTRWTVSGFFHMESPCGWPESLFVSSLCAARLVQKTQQGSMESMQRIELDLLAASWSIVDFIVRANIWKCCVSGDYTWLTVVQGSTSFLQPRRGFSKQKQRHALGW